MMEMEVINELTAMHDTFRVHVLQAIANLCEILPNGSLRNESIFSLEMLHNKKENHIVYSLFAI